MRNAYFYKCKYNTYINTLLHTGGFFLKMQTIRDENKGMILDGRIRNYKHKHIKP